MSEHKRIVPFFLYFGAKYRSAEKYPQPIHTKIIEPFAGAAGYSVNNYWLDIELYDLDPIIAGLWDYLIHVKESEILALPVITYGESIDDYQMCQEARWLIGFHVNQGCATPRNAQTSWALHKPGSQWANDHKKTLIASQLKYIRHWKVKHASYADAPNEEATWFVDPPYVDQGKQYRYGSRFINYSLLAEWCKSRQGQVIVCEQLGANWLDFQKVASVKGKLQPSSEVIWTNTQADHSDP